MHQEILLRHVNFEDLDNAFKLFSDKCARKNSRNTNNISYKEHKSWFLERIEKDGYFTIEDIYKNFVGQARIEKLKNENIISINILSAYRNKGYGLFALKCLISKTNNLTAYINLNNVPSIKLFEKAGFKKISQSGDFLKYYFSNKVFIIAEISANHCNDIVLAKKTISEAKKCGADAVKLQTYTADTLTIDCKNDFFKISGGTSWDNKYYYDLYKESSMDWEWQKELKRYAEEIGIE